MFISSTAITFPTQQAQAATSPLCGPVSGTGAEPITATTVTYGGRKFDIIGYNKNGKETGVAGPNNSVTLFLDKSDYFSGGEFDGGSNSYQGTTLSQNMDVFANSALSTNEGIIERTLIGGSGDYGDGSYNEDNVAGSSVYNQKVWPLSVDEASHLILSTRNFSNYYWLRTPGIFEQASGVGNNGSIGIVGNFTFTSPGGYRAALYLDINHSIFSSLTFDGRLEIGACQAEYVNLGINYVAETVTGLDTVTQGWKIASTYAGLGAPVQQASTSTDIDGVITNSAQSLVFVKAADDNDHFDSDKDRNGIAQQSLATTINIPARPNGPSVTGVAPNDLGASDGKITGTSNKMEYSTDEATWTSVTGAVITGLTSGTYFVRTIADQSASKFKSFATEVVVKEGSAGSGSGPSSGQPGSGTGPSVGDGGFSSEGTAQTGIDFAGLELLLLLILLLVIPAKAGIQLS